MDRRLRNHTPVIATVLIDREFPTRKEAEEWISRMEAAAWNPPIVSTFRAARPAPRIETDITPGHYTESERNAG